MHNGPLVAVASKIMMLNIIKIIQNQTFLWTFATLSPIWAWNIELRFCKCVAKFITGLQDAQSSGSDDWRCVCWSLLLESRYWGLFCEGKVWKGMRFCRWRLQSHKCTVKYELTSVRESFLYWVSQVLLPVSVWFIRHIGSIGGKYKELGCVFMKETALSSQWGWTIAPFSVDVGKTNRLLCASILARQRTAWQFLCSSVVIISI